MGELEVRTNEGVTRHVPVPERKLMSQRTETTRRQRWRVSFTATVDPGQSVTGLHTDARIVVMRRMGELLAQAGVMNPDVDAVLIDSAEKDPYRGAWEGGLQYELHDICEWHEATWRATRASMNRKPDSHSGRGFWEPYVYEEPEADAPFDFSLDDEVADAELVEETPRCPSCGQVSDGGRVPLRFRNRGPFCNDPWHDPDAPFSCPWVTDYDDSIGGEGEISCGAVTVVTVGGDMAVCERGHVWKRCACDEQTCTGWKVAHSK